MWNCEPQRYEERLLPAATNQRGGVESAWYKF